MNVPAFKKSNTQSKWSQIAKQQANVIKKIQLFNRFILFWRVKEATISPCNSFSFFFYTLAADDLSKIVRAQISQFLTY